MSRIVCGTSTDSVMSRTTPCRISAWPAHDERDAKGRIIAAMLLKAAMVSEAIPVIRHVDDHRVFLALVLLQEHLMIEPMF